MRIKLDENIPHSLFVSLTSMGHDVDTVPQEHLAGRDDRAVWNAAQETERFFITQDLDFADIRQFAPGTHHGLLLVRLRSAGRLAVRQRIEMIFESETVEQ